MFRKDGLGKDGCAVGAGVGVGVGVGKAVGVVTEREVGTVGMVCTTPFQVVSAFPKLPLTSSTSLDNPRLGSTRFDECRCVICALSAIHSFIKINTKLIVFRDLQSKVQSLLKTTRLSAFSLSSSVLIPNFFTNSSTFPSSSRE